MNYLMNIYDAVCFLMQMLAESPLAAARVFCVNVAAIVSSG
jgi:hypothetical protein